MATEQPAVTVLSRPGQRQQPSPTLGEAVGPEPSQPVEFRGFDFFAKRDYNELKDASRAYFGAAAAEKNGTPSSWLGDASPPASAHPSLDESRSIAGEFGGFPAPSNERSPRNENKTLRLQRPWFWTLLAIIAVIIIVAIGVGVGVGTSQRASSGSKSAGAANGITSGPMGTTTSAGASVTSGLTISTSSPSPTSIETRTTTSMQTPMATATAMTGCPAVNGTIYQVPGSTKKFLRLCGVDYGKEDGAVDIGNVPTENVTDCIANCAGTTGCVGCGWGFIDGDEGTEHRCWLKSNVKKSHNADMTWAFSVLL
ncbi:hypothetical protein HD806DRAFT_533751 [Xylariaceae sp. AK1471]|nr:hypothetical protein HD806DRAFT_533751 [Xylariaceae sp. AK1471]